MSFHVFSYTDKMWERPPTNLTFIRFITSMSSHVSHKVRLDGEWTITNFTFVVFPLYAFVCDPSTTASPQNISHSTCTDMVCRPRCWCCEGGSWCCSCCAGLLLNMPSNCRLVALRCAVGVRSCASGSFNGDVKKMLKKSLLKKSSPHPFFTPKKYVSQKFCKSGHQLFSMQIVRGQFETNNFHNH